MQTGRRSILKFIDEDHVKALLSQPVSRSAPNHAVKVDAMMGNEPYVPGCIDLAPVVATEKILPEQNFLRHVRILGKHLPHNLCTLPRGIFDEPRWITRLTDQPPRESMDRAAETRISRKLPQPLTQFMSCAAGKSQCCDSLWLNAGLYGSQNGRSQRRGFATARAGDNL